MNFLETLRNFKKIKPDPSYSEKSKRAILASQQNIPARNPFSAILQLIETGAAVALAGFFLLLITGAFSNSTYIAPVQYSVINSVSLHAEADAIDMQIKLADVSYPDVAPNNGSTAQAMAGATSSSQFSRALTAATSSSSGQSSTSTTSEATQTSTAGASTSSVSSVDAALSALSK